MHAGVYKHYRGHHYQVLGIARHSETGQKHVVYVALEGAHKAGPRMSVRPLDGPEGFLTPKVVGGEHVVRFAYVGDSILDAEL